jgi:hypothetical protein
MQLFPGFSTAKSFPPAQQALARGFPTALALSDSRLDRSAQMPHASGKQWSAISVLNPIVPQRDTAPVAGDEPLDKNNTPLYKVTTLLPGRTAANHLNVLAGKGRGAVSPGWAHGDAIRTD